MKKRLAVALAFCTATAVAQTPQEVEDKWNATFARDVWGDPTGIDLVSYGHWHERGEATSEDPLLVFRCRKGRPLSAHVDWRQRLAPRGLLAYEIRGGERVYVRTKTSKRQLVMYLLDVDPFLEHIKGHTHVALFSETGGEPLSARFYVQDLVPAIRERCDSGAGTVVEEEPVEASPEPAPVHVGGNIVPPRVIYQPEAEYTEEAKRARVVGIVILQAVIDASGIVDDVEVLKGVSHGLTESAVAALKASRFEPATENGKPVAVYYTQTVSFGWR